MLLSAVKRCLQTAVLISVYQKLLENECAILMLQTKEGERTEICQKEKITPWQKTVVHCKSTSFSPSSILDE